jgi:hypothetical protein
MGKRNIPEGFSMSRLFARDKAMKIDDGFEYKSYRVHCTAKPTSHGFTADLMITRVTPDRLLERHFPRVALDTSKAEALEHARQIGMAWIDAQETTPAPMPCPALPLREMRVS